MNATTEIVQEDIEAHIKVPKTIGKYRIHKIIGKGSSAIVCLASDKKTQDLYAVKIISRAHIIKNNLVSFVENELRLSARFDHPNLIKVYDIIYEPDTIMIVMEYLPNGDLQGLLCKQCFTLNEQIRICKEILEGLSYLHHRGISHRDIKPENILFDADFHPKIIDFGFSRENSSRLRTFCGTALYIAPEVMTDKQYDGKKADIWSLGVTLHVLNTGKFPWTARSDIQLLRDFQHRRVELKIEATGFMRKLIYEMLNVNPEERPSADCLLMMIEELDKQNREYKKELPPIEVVLPKLGHTGNIKLGENCRNHRLFRSNISWKYNIHRHLD